MYEEITSDVLLERMNNRADTMDRRESSLVYNSNTAAAIELKLLYLELDNVIRNSYGDTASREFLIRLAKQKELDPPYYPATKAVLKAEFVPNDIDLIGERFNLLDINYTVTEMISDGIYKIECETPGTVGNASSGMLVPIDNITGLQSAQVLDLLIAGENEEDTESIRERYLNTFKTKSFGGNQTAYKEFTKAIQDVGAVKVIPVWNGGGTVKLIILNSNFNAASQYLLDTVKNIVDPSPQGTGVGIAPIGHTVTVVSANVVDINISFQLTFDNGFSWEIIKDNVNEILSNYFLELKQDWENQNITIVRISQIESRLLNIKGIEDITNTRINNAESNFTLTSEQIPVIGVVSNEA